ncbi:MAG: RNA polymerase sigma factor [candidate division WOR-3 bacterium]
MRQNIRNFAKERNIDYPYDLDRWFDFCDVVGLLRAYLSLLMKKAEAKENNNILPIDRDGNPDKSKISKEPFSYFHPRGGVFTINPQYRRGSFMLRSALTMSLFDISEKAKFIYCEEEKRRREKAEIALRRVREESELIQNFENLRALTENLIRERINRFHNWSETEVEEIMEKVFQKIGKALPSYEPEKAKNPFSWLMTIVDHAIIDYCRTHKIKIESLSKLVWTEEGVKEPYEPPDFNSPTPSEAYRQKRAHEILIEAMSRMSIKEREILLLITLFPDLSYKEIIKITGHPTEAAAKECKYRMAKKMREILAEMGYGWEMFGEVFRPD